MTVNRGFESFAERFLLQGIVLLNPTTRGGTRHAHYLKRTEAVMSSF